LLSRKRRPGLHPLSDDDGTVNYNPVPNNNVHVGSVDNYLLLDNSVRNFDKHDARSHHNCLGPQRVLQFRRCGMRRGGAQCVLQRSGPVVARSDSRGDLLRCVLSRVWWWSNMFVLSNDDDNNRGDDYGSNHISTRAGDNNYDSCSDDNIASVGAVHVQFGLRRRVFASQRVCLSLQSDFASLCAPERRRQLRRREAVHA
jgi:hypothetical protein